MWVWTRKYCFPKNLGAPNTGADPGCPDTSPFD